MKSSRPVAIVSYLILCTTVLTSCNQQTVNKHENPGQRACILQSRLAGCDRLVVSDVYSAPGEQAPPPFEITGEEVITGLLNNLEFDDLNSGFHCMCSGDSRVWFYKGTNLLVKISHHHGSSLRWNGWDGDSRFTEQAASHWRTWFMEHGEMRFENMHQEKVREHVEQERINNLFLSAFPEGTETIIEQTSQNTDFGLQKPKPSAVKKLKKQFPNRKGLATAVAKGLGHLSAEGADTGSWSTTSTREQLILQLAQNLSEDELREIATSSDPIVRLGAARLFFFEGAYRGFPNAELSEISANLCRTVLERDQCGNAEKAIRTMKHLSGIETTKVLEELVSGKIVVMPSKKSWKDEPSSQFAACLILAYTDSPNTLKYIQTLEKESDLDEFDSAALKVARALLGDTEALDASIFKVDSFTIGYGALDALERHGDKKAVELIIMAGTTHSWGLVRQEAVAVAARMTGQDWNPKDYKNEATVRRWWTENKSSYPD